MLSWLSRWNKVKLNLHWKWIEHTGRGGSSISGAENFELTLPSTYSPIAAVCPFNFKAADTKMAFISPQLNLRCLGENLWHARLFSIFLRQDAGLREKPIHLYTIGADRGGRLCFEIPSLRQKICPWTPLSHCHLHFHTMAQVRCMNERVPLDFFQCRALRRSVRRV